MTTLIIGGTSGLGIALAKKFADRGDKVIATGPSDPGVDYVQYHSLELDDPNLSLTIKSLVNDLPQVDNLIYVAGFWQQAPITDLTDEQIERKLNIGARGIIYTLRELLKKQKSLSGLVVITSMAQWNPSKEEPLYNFVKAGQANLVKGLSKDGQVEKILVVAPTDMKAGSEEVDQSDNVDKTLNKGWVAKQIVDVLADGYKLRLIKIIADPSRVEVVETQ